MISERGEISDPAIVSPPPRGRGGTFPERKERSLIALITLIGGGGLDLGDGRGSLGAKFPLRTRAITLPRQSKAEVLRPIHRMALETLPDVRRELSRLYRGGLNGRVTPAAMTKFAFVLDKIRSCLEAEAAVAAAAPVPDKPPLSVHVVSVPRDYFVVRDSEELSAEPKFRIEHMVNEPIPAPAEIASEPMIEPESEPEPIEEKPLSIMEQARAMGYEPLPKRVQQR